MMQISRIGAGLGAASLAVAVAWQFSPIAARAQTQPAQAAPPAAAGSPETPAAPTAMQTPSMAGPLAANPKPTGFNAGPLGTVYVTGAVSGLVLFQSNAVGGDHSPRFDASNAQVVVQTTEGLVQFYAQGGMYSFPALGLPYLSAWRTTGDFYTPFPVGYVKIAPTDTISLQAGKLPTLIGAEYGFTYQNMNIERGLLWNQEPIVSRGVQGNYTAGPLAFSVSLNDGYYSDNYNWLSGSTAYTINKENTVSFVAGGNFGHTSKNLPKSPFFLNNSQIFNIIYTYNAAPWIVTPYFQYSHVERGLGSRNDNSTVGGAILASYSFNDNVSLAGRFEYISSTGGKTSPNLLYGPGSSAMSLTLTPTYQYGIYFVRGDASLVQAFDTTAGAAFGKTGNTKTQGRFVLEAGVLF